MDRSREAEDQFASEQPSLLSSAWRYRWLVGFMGLLGVIAGLLFSAFRSPTYRASAAVLVEDSSSLFESVIDQNLDPVRFVSQQVEILSSNRVALEAASSLRTPFGLTSDQVSQAMDIQADHEASKITVSFEGESPQLAKAGADAIIASYEKVVQEQARERGDAALLKLTERTEEHEIRLDELQAELADLNALDPVRTERLQRFVDALAKLNQLQKQRESLGADDARLPGIRDQIADLEQDLRLWETITRIEESDPQLTALLSEQRSILDQMAVLRGRQDDITIEAELAGPGIRHKDPAQLPTSPAGAALSRLLGVFGLLGLAGGTALAYMLAVRSRVVTSRIMPEAVLDAPYLAEVPAFSLEGIKSPLPVRVAPTSASAEAFRFAAVAIESRSSMAGSRSLMMVSATLGAGKTTVAANTAIAAAREGLRVLMIDADFGNQALTQILLGDPFSEVGITEVVDGVDRLQDVVQHIVIGENRSVDLLSRGRRPVEAATVLRSEKARQFFAEIRESYDLVIVDGPPMLQVAYAGVLVRYVDSAVVVVPHGSRVGELEELADRIRLSGTPILGYVYTKAPLRQEMTASEGSMKDILGKGFEVNEGKPSVTASKRRAGRS